MPGLNAFRDALAACRLVAILRGIAPDEVRDIGEALIDSGFTIIEVPLNSPRPFESIERLANCAGERAVIGAGTVIAPADVARVRNAGGRIVVAPNCDQAVIRSAARAGLAVIPGFLTPTEAFAAISAGASALKLFPAEAANPAVLRAHRAVLPKDVPLLVVGGVTPETVPAWLAAGADGFGLGSALYRPGSTAVQVRTAAAAFLQSVRSQTG